MKMLGTSQLLFLLILACSGVCGCAMTAMSGPTQPQSSAEPPERLLCAPGDSPPPNRVDTTQRVAQLRALMLAQNISAYIVLTNDEHQSEMVAEYDKRREFISGFSGSAGWAVITASEQALWTDSRYHLQADQQLDCHWSLMRYGLTNVTYNCLQIYMVPSLDKWLADKLGPDQVISADSRTVPHKQWKDWSQTFEANGLTIQEIEGNLVDEVWGTARPPYPTEPAYSLNETRYTGLTWCEKVAAVLSKVNESGATAHVVSALDEVTWLLNVRAHDIEYLPVVRSYLILELQPEPAVSWFVHPSKVTRELRDFLRHCTRPSRVKIFEYEKFWAELRDLGTRTSTALLPQAFSYNLGASHAIFSALPEEKVKFGPPPVAAIKNQKNPTEARGMKNAHIRDAAALIIFLAKLEAGIKAGETWTEQMAADELARARSRQPLNRGLSFGSISASGSHSAMPHYIPSPDTDAPINTTAMYMLDSGGQYLDGTTDVTRTLHFGTPTNDQRATYTRLLMGCIRIVSAVFPVGTTLKELDILVRGPLYSQGRDFGHGATHGIGHFLGVHEAFNTTLVENFFGSQEPGYYLAGQWGMRLENIVTVVKAEFPENSNEDDTKFLKFEPVTLVPYEPNLIDVTLLSDKQVDWLNKYNARVRAEVRPLLESQCEYQAIAWLDAKTQPISWSRTDL